MKKFFQIHEKGKAIDDKKYGNFEMLCLEWSKQPSGREVVEVDHAGNLVRRFSAEECRKIATRLTSTAMR